MTATVLKEDVVKLFIGDKGFAKAKNTHIYPWVLSAHPEKEAGTKN